MVRQTTFWGRFASFSKSSLSLSFAVDDEDQSDSARMRYKQQASASFWQLDISSKHLLFLGSKRCLLEILC